MGIDLFFARRIRSRFSSEIPSEIVKGFTGTKSVSEAASLLASGADSLLLTKQKYKEEPNGKNLTIAVSRIPHPKRPNLHRSVLKADK